MNKKEKNRKKRKEALNSNERRAFVFDEKIKLSGS
jgi:hypothetical protein